MKVFLAETKTNIRYGLSVLLGEQPGLEIVGESADLENILPQINQTGPDLVIMSWDIPSSLSKELMHRMRKCFPKLFVIALSTNSNLREFAIQSGANDFFYKGDSPEGLLSSIQELQETEI